MHIQNVYSRICKQIYVYTIMQSQGHECNMISGKSTPNIHKYIHKYIHICKDLYIYKNIHIDVCIYYTYIVRIHTYRFMYIRPYHHRDSTTMCCLERAHQIFIRTYIHVSIYVKIYVYIRIYTLMYVFTIHIVRIHTYRFMCIRPYNRRDTTTLCCQDRAYQIYICTYIYIYIAHISIYPCI